MNKAIIIDFAVSFLRANNLDVKILKPPYGNIGDNDHGLREKLGFSTKDGVLEKVLSESKEGVFYHITDEYSCSYSYFTLNKEKGAFIFVGPYTFELIDNEKILSIMKNASVSEVFYDYMWNYFGSLTYVEAESAYLNLFIELGNHIWGKQGFSVDRKIKNLNSTNDNSPSMAQSPNQASLEILEERYNIEDEMLSAVAQGNLDLANHWLDKFMLIRFAPREKDYLRNSKNRLIIFNTLLRKSAELGGVHPLHLDRISDKYAKRIEKITHTSQEHEMYRIMVHNYCLWVRNYSLKGYSLVVKKAITLVDFDISADLGLNTVAERLNVNPSYLSAVFKKDTGVTFTDFVNKRRIKQAHFLLNSTDMQIQNIGILCGITDLNYFTKLFKKYTGMTPSEYRKTIK